jgi:hypothetical protein
MRASCLRRPFERLPYDLERRGCRIVRLGIPFLLVLIFAGTGAGDSSEMIRLPEESMYREEPFSEEIFSMIPTWGQACDALGVSPWDVYSKSYLFSDGVLTVEGHSTEGAVSRFTPLPTISVKEALDIGRVLAAGDLPELIANDSGGILFEDVTLSGSGCRLSLTLNRYGDVTEITYSFWSP